MDRVALALLAVYVAYRIARSAGAVLPFSTFIGFLAFVALAYLFVRLIPWFRMRVLWSLRNRLVAAYVFMAVVPVMLLMTMIGIATYLFYLQLGAHLLQDAVQERVNTIRADADTIAGAIERESAASATPIGPEVLDRPSIAGLISSEQANWPGLTVSVNRGQPLLATSGGQHYAGLVEYQGILSFVSAQRRSVRAGPFTVLVIAPLTSALLDEFPEELGPIQLILMKPAEGAATGRLSLEIDGHLYATSEQIASTRRTLLPPTNWLDMRFQGGSTFKVFHADPGKDTPDAPVLASFWLRPVMVNRNLFKSVGALGPYLIGALMVAAAIFVVMEIAVLATGWMLTRTITRSIADLYDGTLHVRRGDFSHRVRVTQRDQLGALGESFNEMTTSITELIEEQRERQRLENEVSIAREVQQQLFPHSLPAVPGLELGAICRPARVVSGDYYDFISLSPTRVGIALADISGKGIFASLLMASLQAALRSAATLDAKVGTAEVVSRVNRHLFSNTSDDRYATLFYAVYDSQEKTLTYTNAGHLPPFFLTDGRVEMLDQGGTVVGLFDDARYAECTRKVAPGSLLVAFSDGLTEPESVYGEEFGIERLKAEVVRRREAPAAQLAEDLIAATEQWAGTPEQADDVTVVVARMGS
ncbi:MAG TPA: SpoIIE family protein phosphatase [Candidatus Acidoferrales bacterium]|nr:SpoIIE family protein phosphatase [Candidatus Acidoferrales bacterium]